MEKKIVLSLVFLLMLFTVPVYAQTLEAYTDGFASTSFVNTVNNLTVLTLTFNSSDDPLIVEALNVHVEGSSNSSNVSALYIVNSTGHTIGSNTSTNGESSIFINFSSTPLEILSNDNKTLSIIAQLVGTAAPASSDIGFNITAASDVYANVSIASTYPANTTIVSIQDVHATVLIGPKNVDTSVFNQTFIINITPTGDNGFENITILLPEQFNNTYLAKVTRGGSEIGTSDFSNTSAAYSGGTALNISLNLQTIEELIINITLNTSVANTGNLSLNVTFFGSNLTEVRENAASNIGVNTRQFIVVDMLTGQKPSALPNGTDFWLFQFTLNFTANESGVIHFRMNHWNNTGGPLLTINSTSTNYATFYTSTNESIVHNVSTEYKLDRGVQVSTDSTTSYQGILKMIIPSGTQVTSSWWTTYGLLFRAQP